MANDKTDKPDNVDKENVVDLSAYDTEGKNSDSAADDADPLSAIRELRVALDKAQKDYLYLRADFDNYKKGAIKDRSDLAKYGNERILVELLTLVDTFDKALSMEITADNYQSFKEGMQLMRAEFQNALVRFGVQKIDSAGEAFDPNIHEAISSEPTDKVPAGHISQVFKPAYKLHDRIIRPAQVVVAREPDKNSDTDSTGNSTDT